MQNYPLQLQEIQVQEQMIGLFVPDPKCVQPVVGDVSPYWARLWPAALALANFIERFPEWVKNRNCLELGAGLGLPSFTAARYAALVTVSDYNPACITVLEKAIIHNRYTNVTVRHLDWLQLPERLETDVLLLSDVNYDPLFFPDLIKAIKKFLDAGTLVLLSTPQRLLAKPFLEALLPGHLRVQQDGIFLDQPTSIFVLGKEI